MIRSAAAAIALWHLLPAAAALAQDGTFPLDLGVPFTLDASTGGTRTEFDPAGHFQILFFGYSSCAAMCPTILPTVAEVTDLLADEGLAVTPVMITVDPARDTLDHMAEALTQHHPAFVGLTGSPEALAAVYDGFGIDTALQFHDAHAGDVISHQSHLFLLAPDGTVATILPPILPTDRMADIVAGYITAEADGAAADG